MLRDIPTFGSEIFKLGKATMNPYILFQPSAGQSKTELKPAVLHLKINPVLHPACGGGNG